MAVLPAQGGERARDIGVELVAAHGLAPALGRITPLAPGGARDVARR
jgi:hypothetical protein